MVYSLVDVLTPKKQLVAALHAYKKEFTQSEVYKVTKIYITHLSDQHVSGFQSITLCLMFRVHAHVLHIP